MKPNLVVDANVAVGWSADSPHSAACVRILRESSALMAADQIVQEVDNAFYQLVRAGTANKERLRDGLEFLPRWFAELLPSASLRSRAMGLALELEHPAYDCFYLALAVSRQVKLISADGRFLRKAAAKGYGNLIAHLEDW